MRGLKNFWPAEVGYFLPRTHESRVAADIPRDRAASSIPYRGTSRRSIFLWTCTAPPFNALLAPLSIYFRSRVHNSRRPVRVPQPSVLKAAGFDLSPGAPL